jgi:acyl carrier protein
MQHYEGALEIYYLILLLLLYYEDIMSTMSRESADVTLQLIADHLNISMTSLDVSRTYEELGGDSVTLLRLINSLKSKSIPIPIPVFNSPNTIQDVLTYVQRKDQPTSHEHDLGLDHQQHQHPSVYRIEPYADVADKEHLINMCCRSFITNNLVDIAGRCVQRRFHCLRAQLPRR